MGVTVESITPLGVDVHYRQAGAPNYLRGSFLGDDTDSHDFKFASRGKGRGVTVSMDNAPNKELTYVIYGMHSLAGTVGDVGTFSVVTNVVALGAKGAQAVTAPYPFYLVRLSYAAQPTDNPVKSCSLYVDLSPY